MAARYNIVCSKKNMLTRNMLSRIYILLVLIVSVLSATIVSAQRPDMLLSSDITISAIPADLLIQSMATIGTTHLVVWGSAERAGDDARGVLYMQMLHDTVPIGHPVPIVNAPARPTRFVQVIALEDRFVVLWNDERPGAVGLYGRVVDINRIFSPERRYWPGKVSEAGIAVHRTESGGEFFWNDVSSAGGIYALTIDRDGNPRGGAHIIAEGNVRGIRRLPSGDAMLDRGELLPLMFDKEGAVEYMSDAIAAKFLAPYYLGNNGEVITMTRDTVNEYYSVLDSTPLRSRLVRLPEGCTVSSVFPSRNAQGKLQILYSVGGGFTSGGGPGVISGEVRSTIELSAGVFGTPTPLYRFTIRLVYSHCQTVSLSPDLVIWRRIANNQYIANVHYKGQSVIDCQGVPLSRDEITQNISYAASPHSAMADSLFVPSLALDPSGVTLFRAKSVIGSAVDVAIGTKLIRLIAPSILRTGPGPHQSPVLRVSNGRLMAGWMSVGLDTTVSLGWWNPSMDAYAPIGSFGLANSMPIDPTRKGLIGETKLVSTGSDIVLATAWRWQVPEDVGHIHRQLYMAYAATDTGWQLVKYQEGYRQAHHFAHAAIATNPVTGALFLAFGSGVASTVFDILASSIDSNGTELWQSDTATIDPVGYGSIIPTTGDSFLIVNQKGLLSFRLDGTSTPYPLAPKASQRLLRLADSSFLRASIDGFNITTIERIDFTGAIRATRSGLYLPPGANLFMVQDPATRAIALLYGGGDGVRMSLIDEDLNLIRENEVIGESRAKATNPSAAFLGDSLYVLWEDYRDSLPVIYGTAVGMSAGRSGHDDPEGDRVAAGIPSHEFDVMQSGSSAVVRISGEGRERIRWMELYDGSGRLMLVREMTPGERELRMATDDLPSGVYLLRMRDGDRSVDRKFVVLH